MKLLELPHTLSEKIDRLLQPILASGPVTGSAGEEQHNGWQAIVEQLCRWTRDPAQLSDEEVEAPTSEVLAMATAVAEVLRDAGVEPPDHLVPNGDGGIVFRWRSGQRAWSIELDSDGSLESYLLQQGKLVWRHSLHE
jgi:hypothetical protein